VNSSSETNHITLDVEGFVGVLRINRPEKLNAMTVAMDETLNALVYEINNTSDIRAVVLHGEGGKAFSAGSDITDLDKYGGNWRYRNRFDENRDYARAIWKIRKPVIASIDGYCIGGGLEMACGADIRIASHRSQFAAGEINWGWHGGSGATQLLTHLIGSGHASRLLLTGSRISADEAHRIGLVQELVDSDQVFPTALELATDIASKSPIATQKTKFMIRAAHNIPLDVALLVENDSFSYLMMTEDAKEGQQAFAEKRPPRFTGE
jgi:enoyl-CoA hydratase